MISIGRTQDLTILRRSDQGWILGDEDELEALLPHADVPEEMEVGDTIRVFVLRDDAGRSIASIRSPRVELGGFAQLRVNAEDEAGAYVDWGLDTELFVPNDEQQKALKAGRWYVVHVALDKHTDRIYGSTRIADFLNKRALNLERGDTVTVLVFGRSPLGLSVIVDDKHQGLVHADDIFRHVAVGDRIPGFVKRIRDDGKLDITLQAIGFEQYNDANTALLIKRLQGSSGFLPFNDKSSPEAIQEEFGMSKKAFKKALGTLYKERKVRIEETGVVWVG